MFNTKRRQMGHPHCKHQRGEDPTLYILNPECFLIGKEGNASQPLHSTINRKKTQNNFMWLLFFFSALCFLEEFTQ